MTEAKKTGLTLTAIVAAVILAGSAWPAVEPALTWTVKNLGAIFAREQVQAVVAAITGGVLLGGVIPHFLPDAWLRARTKMVSGLACGLFALAIAAVLVPTRYGAVYAVLAAVAAPQVTRWLSGLTYWLRPAAKPGSLQ